MFRQLIPAATAAALLIPLALGCESAGSKSAAPTASPAALSEKQAAAVSPSAQSAIPTGVDRRYDPVYSYVDEVRSELSDGKAALINQVMRLSRDEGIIFWPIYNEYEDELFTLGDQRVELMRKLVKSQTDQSLDNATARSLSNDWFKFESQRLELVRKYHERIAKELSPLHAAQFAQVEHRVATVIDLLLASDMPLIQPVAHH
jgi:hypothetical protein